jgi:hypothetical protein
MSAQPVDVLDVMETAALKAVWERDEADANGDEVRGETYDRLRADLREARAAVAELMAAMGAALERSRCLHPQPSSPDEHDGLTPEARELFNRCAAALARCGGAP